MKDFYILDTTLRDGEQTPGVSFTKQEKVEIAQKMAQAGVDVIEAGIPAMGQGEQEAISEILSLDLPATILAWNRMKIADIDASLACGAKNIHISAPASDLHIYRKLGKKREWVLEELKKVVSYAVEKGCQVSVGAEDASRTTIEQLVELYGVAKKAGALRVRYADTVGALEPLATYNIINSLTEQVDLEFDFHGHNDFGMATANGLSAFKAGAKYISCSINGLGERAGNTALEELIMALKHIEGYTIDFDFEKLTELSELVEKASGRKIAEGKPIVGKEVFSHESGIHVDGLLKDSRTYEVFSPELLGRRRNFVVGKFSGTTGIMHRYNEMGISVDRNLANQILQHLRRT